tara:strand:- start:388 stop:1473 length:1086 start_codon:yes stop_codon:yes gene_type:complete
MKNLYKAVIVLEDGKIFSGYSSKKFEHIGEIVFTTSMTGYQKALTDPSYYDQILVMTYPLQGNYGTNQDQNESNKVQVKGFIIKELTDVPSHWKNKGTLKSFLNKNNIPFVTDVDTRALTKHLRRQGTMMGAISTGNNIKTILKHIQSFPKYGSEDIVSKVSTKKTSVKNHKSKGAPRVIIVDLGVKNNIKRILEKNGCNVIVVPHTLSYQEIESLHPDGIILSPGPGDPMQLLEIAGTVKQISESYPTLGICLGHQILGIAYGASSYKLPYGNRGSNHPVLDTTSKQVFITSQNHGYAIDPKGLEKNMKVSQVNLNDGHVEALNHSTLPVSSIQYHPEASPGPHDTEFIFNNFLNKIKKG